MNQMTFKRMIAMLMMLTMLCSFASAENTGDVQADPGNMPERGIILALTQADIDMGLKVATYMRPINVDGEERNIPTIVFQYLSHEADETANAQFSEMYENGNFDAYDAILMEYLSRCYTYARIFLMADEKIADAAVKELGEMTFMKENDGYTYMLLTYAVELNEKDDPAIVEAAGARVAEMINTIQYQPVVISEEELAGDPDTTVPNAFPTFTTQDLNGNTVDNSIFANADLTVLNLWGTNCYPCISEMPELQAWSEEMPENVQLIGLALDVRTGDTDGIETAQTICDATGVTYINMILPEDLFEFANGIIFSPTTIFVDRNGAIVGEPITGAMVDAYKDFVAGYFGE